MRRGGCGRVSAAWARRTTGCAGPARSGRAAIPARASLASRADGTDRGLVCVLPEPRRDQRGDSGGRPAVRRENGVTLPVLGRVAQRGVGARGQSGAVARRRAGGRELGHPPLASPMDTVALTAARNPARERAGRSLAVALV